jgi:hypothetical protein
LIIPPSLITELLYIVPVPPVIPVPASVAIVFASSEAKPADDIDICVVSVPVPVALATDVNPPVDLIGPENVELPILISLSWQMSAYAVKVKL